LGIEIGVESEQGQGTTFWLQIPLAYQPKTSDVQRHLPSQRSTVQVQEEENIFPELSLNAVILCLSTQETCHILSQRLEGLPLTVQNVASIDECIEQGKTQLVWAAIVEPNGKGFEALTRLKDEPSLSSVPFIFCAFEPEKIGFHLGPVEHLTKPVESDQLIDILVRVTKKQRGVILAVDDDENLREIYRQTLSSAGYTPSLARNGREALDYLQDRPLPQAIILDLLMPEMDGFQVLSRIQLHDAWRRIPIIVVTGKELTNQERQRIQGGAQLLLEKDNLAIEMLPKQIENLIHTVTQAGTQSILVVDDNKMNLDLMASIFRSAGYLVHIADSGQTGIQIAREVVPDVIVMDLGMPGMDGFEATQQIKQVPAIKDIPVIACSAFATRDSQKRAFQAGCEGYITKPIEPERLVEQVTKLVLTANIRRRLKMHDEDTTD
jgi:CheY-like chemotaxis protein